MFQEGHKDKLVLLECGASYPSDFYMFNLHPMLVYVQVGRLKVCCVAISSSPYCPSPFVFHQVLQTLAKEHHKDANERTQVLDAARRLFELPSVSGRQ